ncbi:AMP-binding enzyme [Cupriavidus basilensis]
MDTGDLGYLDAENWLWITGRAKDLIIRGGHNIDPKMVEEVLFGNPAIQDAAVIGAPDAHSGEVPVAYVVLKPGSKASTEELLHYAATHCTRTGRSAKAVLPASPDAENCRRKDSEESVEGRRHRARVRRRDRRRNSGGPLPPSRLLTEAREGFLVEICVKGELP